MNRYIDAEWLKQNFNTVFWSQITKTIDSAPSIDIVRCDECQYYEDGHCESAEMWQSINGYTTECESMSRNADDFCSYGERNADSNTFNALDALDDNSSEKPNNCDTCKHNKLEWYSEVCDGCSKAHSNYEPKDEPQTCSFSDCDNFKNPDYERCIECKRKQIKLKTEQTEREGE